MANAIGSTSSINGVTVSGVAAASEVLTATSATAATWEAGGSGGGITPPAGDLGGTATVPVVDKINGVVTSGQYARGNGTAVVMSTIQTADVPTLNQNTTGTAATATVSNGLNSASTTVAVNGATAPSSGQVLTATSSTAANWQTPATSSGPFNWTQGEALASGESTIPRMLALTTNAPTKQVVTLMYWTAVKSETATNVTLTTGETAATGLTYACVAFFSVNVSTGALTQVATTGDIHTGNFTATFSSYDLSLGTGFTKVAGTMYAMAVLFVGTTPPTLQSSAPGAYAFISGTYANGQIIASQQTTTATTMPTSITLAGQEANQNGPQMIQAIVGPSLSGSPSTTIFFDDFTGTAGTLPSSTYWNVINAAGDPLYGSGDQEYYVNNTNIIYQDGSSNLIIKCGTKGTDGATSTTWPTGRVDTYASPGYGTTPMGETPKVAIQPGQSCEFYVKINPLAGTWPANWFINVGPSGGSYPQNYCEFDLQESGDSDPNHSVPTAWGPGSSNQTNLTAATSGHPTSTAVNDGNYHLYRIDFDSSGNSISAYVDGALVYTITKTQVDTALGTGFWLYNTTNGLFIVMNVAVNNSVTGTNPSAGALPATIMAVDYVRVYSPAGPYTV